MKDEDIKKAWNLIIDNCKETLKRNGYQGHHRSITNCKGCPLIDICEDSLMSIASPENWKRI